MVTDSTQKNRINVEGMCDFKGNISVIYQVTLQVQNEIMQKR
jgi:hypothetical protein